MKTKIAWGGLISSRLRVMCVMMSVVATGFFVIPVTILAQTAPSTAVGDGSAGNPYQIATLGNLYWLSIHSELWSNTFVLSADIDASETANHALAPIGNATTPFTGKFHGQGHRIKNLSISLATTNYVGLFGYANYPAQIDSLGVTNSNIIGNKGTGALAGYCAGVIVTCCFATDDTVVGHDQCVGVLMGWLESSTVTGTVSKCFSSGKATSTVSDVGGLIGWTRADVYNCYSTANVSAATAHGTGGLVGFAYEGHIIKCYATGKPTGTAPLGGLVGAGQQTYWVLYGWLYNAVIDSSYWDTLSSQVSVSCGGTGKSTADMKTQSTFAGWDFTTIWAVNSAVNSGYPCFIWASQPVVATSTVTGAMDSTGMLDTVMCQGSLVNLSMFAPTSYGICWNTTGTPTVTDNKIDLGAASKAQVFSARIAGLNASQYAPYYVRAFASNAISTSYGNQVSFIRGVKSYHWQASESFAPVCSSGNTDDTTFFRPVNTGNFNVLDSSALWLDSAANGKRYGFDLNASGGMSYGYKFNPALTAISHTFYVIAKNTVPSLQVVLQRTASTYYQVNFKYSNDTIYASRFGRNNWAPTHVTLSKAKTSGTWIPYYVHLRNITADSVRVSFGCANQELAFVTVADSTGGTWSVPSTYCWANSDSAAGLIADAHVFSSYDTTGVARLWPVFFSPAYINNGPLIRVPTLIHNILYDPPGNQSFSTCTFDTTVDNRINFNWSANAGASLELGLKGSIDFGIALGVEATTGVAFSSTVSGEVHYKYDHNNGTEISLDKSSSMSSMVDDAEPGFIGPTFGDVVAYQSFAYRTSIMKRPRTSKFRTATDPKDFVYEPAGGLPVPDSCSPDYFLPIQTVISNLKGDTAGLAFLQKEYPFDLKTGKVLQSALDSAVDPVTNRKNPPRLEKYGNTQVITGNISFQSSATRQQIITADSTHSWGASVNYNEAVWSIAGGYELNIGGGCDFAITGSSSNGQSSVVSYTFQDNNSWDVFKITPYMDNRFKTLCFIIDSANSYSSFPHEANTRPAVTWQISSVPACTGSVGQATVVTVSVKNTSPASVVSGLPDAFLFTVSAINFPGTYTVYPENVKIATGQTVTYTCTFTGASAGTFMQQLDIACWNRNNFDYMDEAKSFSMTMKNGDVGLVVSNPKDTATILRGTAVSYVFNVKMVNVGIAASAVTFGSDSVSPGTTVHYGTIANPVAAGDSATLAITLTGDTSHDYFTLNYWAQIGGDSMTTSRHTLVIKVTDPVGVVRHPANIIRELGVVNMGGGRLELLVPASESPTLRLFSFNGRTVVSQRPVVGTTILDLKALHLANGFYILRLQGKKLVQQKILVSGRR